MPREQLTEAVATIAEFVPDSDADDDAAAGGAGGPPWHGSRVHPAAVGRCLVEWLPLPGIRAATTSSHRDSNGRRHATRHRLRRNILLGTTCGPERPLPPAAVESLPWCRRS